ncbi:hypothetical protein EIP86_010919 [Pleurotus ostreatoroseus]|nr:hypothetical protein EIP86_010919 [Pleurotus ostreatoroseus]
MQDDRRTCPSEGSTTSQSRAFDSSERPDIPRDAIRVKFDFDFEEEMASSIAAEQLRGSVSSTHDEEPLSSTPPAPSTSPSAPTAQGPVSATPGPSATSEERVSDDARSSCSELETVVDRDLKRKLKAKAAKRDRKRRKRAR